MEKFFLRQIFRNLLKVVCNIKKVEVVTFGKEHVEEAKKTGDRP